jgi:hypothetical protein
LITVSGVEAGEKSRMQRVRIGLTGLAFVFVLVLLAAVFTRPTDEAPITANSLSQPDATGDPANEAEPSEPLAELGVAPGKADANAAEAADELDPGQ